MQLEKSKQCMMELSSRLKGEEYSSATFYQSRNLRQSVSTKPRATLSDNEDRRVSMEGESWLIDIFENNIPWGLILNVDIQYIFFFIKGSARGPFILKLLAFTSALTEVWSLKAHLKQVTKKDLLLRETKQKRHSLSWISGDNKSTADLQVKPCHFNVDLGLGTLKMRKGRVVFNGMHHVNMI